MLDRFRWIFYTKSFSALLRKNVNKNDISRPDPHRLPRPDPHRLTHRLSSLIVLLIVLLSSC